MEKIRNIQKFPSKIFLTLHWYEAAIAHLLLFKYLKQKHNNSVYFLISEQGILLKAKTAVIRDNVKEEIDRFFTAKIEQLEISQSPEFYDTILKDIQDETERLKGTRDCPYINLVYSEKMKNSCLAMKKFGYVKPYEHWESHERERKGFCYLIVRPEHRWKEIASNVIAIVKKRETSNDQLKKNRLLQIDISYEKFIWIYLRKQFESLRKGLEIKEDPVESKLSLFIEKSITQYPDTERLLGNLQWKYLSKKPVISKQPNYEVLVLSSFEVEKITELIFHEFGLPKLVRQTRRKCSEFLAIGADIETLVSGEEELNAIESREDLIQINWKDVEHIFKLGKKNSIVKWEGSNCVAVRFDNPLKQNIQKVMKIRMPFLPKYYAYFHKDSYIYVLRKYEPIKFKTFLQEHRQTQNLQIEIICSLIEIVRQLHKRKINVGSKFSDNIFIDQSRIVIEPGETGSNVEDVSKLTLILREWVKSLKESELKEEIERINDPFDLLEHLENFLDDWA